MFIFSLNVPIIFLNIILTLRIEDTEIWRSLMKMTKAEKWFYPALKLLKFAFFPLALCYFEILIHYFAYRSFSTNLIWGIVFGIGIGSLLSFLSNVFSPRVNRVLHFVFASFFTLVFEIQLVYFQIFKGFAPVSSIGLGAQAVTNFTGGMFEGIKTAILWIFLILIPLALLITAVVRYRPSFKRRDSLIKVVLPLVISLVVLVGSITVMSVYFSGTPSLYSMFTSSDTSTDTSVNCFGLSMTMMQEIRFIIFPQEKEVCIETMSDATYDPEKYNVDPDVDFQALLEKAIYDEKLEALTAALSNLPASEKHKYTGICEGYNLVAICAEAFSPEFISPELTPTLYKLINGGFVFENFYSTFPNTTTNGEYTFCMGIFPDLTRTKTDSSFSISAANYLPYCYGNVFREMGGIAQAYHNYVGEFYYRNFTHPNMGYDFTAANSGLDIEISWPSSDHDMFINSVKNYAYSGKQFAAYYMTFSGHYAYNLDNAMSAKNWDKVEHLDASDAVKAYIACNLELEYALQHLMETLEDAGVADKTVVVLTTDHYPYGLSADEYSELSGSPINNIFDKMENAFICYVPGIEPVKVDTYCSSQDILPTVLNLFGVKYDSRLLAGVDVLAPNAKHVAVIADGSFITEGIRYDASSVSFSLSENTTEARIEAEQLYAHVTKLLSISVDILNNNYYTFVFDRESTSEGVNNLTTVFDDVGIMKQSSIYYMLTHEYMEPEAEKHFGTYSDATVDEVLNVAYRVVGRPKTSMTINDIPFHTDIRAYEGSAVWAYEIGLLDPMLFPDNLSDKATITQLARVLYTIAEIYEYDTSVDEEELVEKMAEYPDTSELNARISLFCADHNLLNENGGDAGKLFDDPEYKVRRWYVAEEIYKLCSYYLFVNK